MYEIYNLAFGLMAITSDGQTFLGAGQKKNLAGHNDLL